MDTPFIIVFEIVPDSLNYPLNGLIAGLSLLFSWLLLPDKIEIN